MTERELDKIREEAAEWWSRRSDAGVENRRAFAQWLAADPRHGTAFDDIESAWEIFAEPDATEAELTPPASVSPFRTRAGQPPARISRRALFGGGAVAAALAVGAVMWGVGQKAQVFELQTGTGGRRTQTLADGSQIELDANSHVRVSLSSHARKLELLRGRAMFDVTKDAARPFVVHTAEGVVTVLGTLFWVESRDAETIVTLVRGRVRAEPAAGGQAVAMVPGDRLSLKSGGHTALIRGVDPDKAVAWRTGRLIFENEPLSRVVDRMNDYSAEQIRIDGKAADLRITGVFQAGQNAAFLDALQTYYGLSVRKDGRQIIVQSPA